MSIRRPLAFAALAALVCAFATSAAKAQWEVGAKIGVGQAGFTGSSEFEWDTGPSSSAFVNYQLGPALAAQLEFAPVRTTGISTVAGSSLTLTADYLTFPLLLQLRLPTPSGILPFVSAGPILSVRSGCSLRFVGGGVESNSSCDASGRASGSPVTVSLGAGAGFQRSVGPLALLVEGRGTTGLSVETLPVDARRPHHFGWALLAGVSFPLGQGVVPPPPRRPGAMSPAGVQRVELPVPTLPEVAAVAIAPIAQAPASSPDDALSNLDSGRRVSVHAVDADVRSLLLVIARQGGVSIIVDPLVTGRVSVNLTDVPVGDALRAVIEAAHLSVAGPSTAAAPAIVFYQLPVNVDTAPAETIARRFNVSDELARWMAENQPKKTSP